MKRCFLSSKSALTNSRNCSCCSSDSNSERNNRHCFRRLVISACVMIIRHLIVRPFNPYALHPIISLYQEVWILVEPKDGVCKELCGQGKP